MRIRFSGVLIALTFLAGGIGKSADAPPPTNVYALSPVVSYLSPEDEAKTFVIEDGYQLELVVSDPIIKEPVVTVFDGDGRMFVAEMRSYMQDIDGTDEHDKRGRISVHWSSKKNGVYDRHEVFADNLVLPRMILPLAEGILVNETDSEDLWLYRDTKHNGVADKKELVYKGGGRGGNLEHQASGLIWDLDNWMYMAANSYRLRLHGTNFTREDIPSNNGQWGVCQDNYGKLWFVNASYEAGPLNFQIPILYGDAQYDEQAVGDWYEVWPLIGLADVQGGTTRFRPEEKSLNHFTGTCGGAIYRGDRLPADLRGDLLFGEPVGRLIRRAKIEVKEGFTYASNAYKKSEFIRSSDPNFRPVNMTTAPDGTLYITDMYRGIIQEKDWVNEGSYLRGVVKQYSLDKNFGRGRIWRLVHPGFKPGPQPHLLEETPSKWVSYLDHPNGWWRDNAQKLLVLKQDKSVVPALLKMTQSDTNHLARIHALWTLEGLDGLTPALIREKLKDQHPQVRIAAIRTSETLYKKGDHSLIPDIYELAKDPDANVVLQVIMTAHLLQSTGWEDLINSALAQCKAFGVQKIGAKWKPAGGTPAAPNNPATPNAPAAPPASPFTVAEQKVLTRGGVIYKELCFACHGLDGKGTPFAGAKPGTTMAPPLSGSKTVNGFSDGVVDVVLKGLSGPVNGKTYDAQMVPMESNDDSWVASVLSYVRNNFDNHAAFIDAKDVARVRASLKSRTNTWTLQELSETMPQPLTNRASWKLTASHNPGALHLAVDGNITTRYDSGTSQKPGMWVQVELPEEVEVTGVDLDAGTSTQDYARGYTVQVSKDGVNWRPAVMGKAPLVRNQIFFTPRKARFVRINQTGTDPSYFWSIHELQILQVAAPRELFSVPDLFNAPGDAGLKTALPEDSASAVQVPFSTN